MSIVSDKGKFKKFLCQQHYNHYRKYGKLRELNKIIEKENWNEIEVWHKGQQFSIKVDKEDMQKCNEYHWHVNANKKNYYGFSSTPINGIKTRVKIHDIIFGKAPAGMCIDHINGDGLDNRRCNLRYCTFSQNTINSKTRDDNKSGHRGVYFVKSKQLWLAVIQINKKRIFLGSSENMNEMIKVRKEAEIKYFGEFQRPSI